MSGAVAAPPSSAAPLNGAESDALTVSAAAQRSRRRLPLAGKLAIALIGLVTLVLLINGAVSLWLNYEESKRAALGVQQEKAQAAAERVDGFISDVENQIGWTTRAEWRRVPLEQQRYDFIRLLRQAPALTEVSYLDPAGKEQLKVSRLEPDQVGSGKDLSNEPRFKQAVADKVWFGPVYFRRGSEPYMTVAVAHAGRNPGVTTAEVNLKLVWDVITAIKVGEKGHAFVVTSAGRLIAHPDLSLVLRDTDLSGVPQVARALPSARQAGEPGIASVRSELATDLSGNAVLSAHAPIGRVGWLVFVQSPVSEALAPVYRSLMQTLALLGLGLLLATVAGTVLARRMIVPIRHLQEGAERLGSGDLSQRIAIRTGDEIETLAERFNQMAGRIQESYETLEGRVEERTRELQETLNYQTATGEVLRVISSSPDALQPVLDVIVETSHRLCGSDNSTVFLLSEGKYRLAAASGGSPSYLDFARTNPMGIDDAGSTTARAARLRRTIHVPDINADPEFGEGMMAVGDRRAVLSVPLMRNGVAVGVITMRQTYPKSFTDRQIEVVQTFADQAVIAINNVRLFEEVQARTAELSESLQQQTATAEVLKVISRSAFDLDTVLSTLTRSATELCSVASGLIYLRRGDEYRLGAAVGLSPERTNFFNEHPRRPGRDSIVPRVALSGAVEQVPDIDADPEWKLPRSPESPTRAALGVPLLRNGTVEGVFILMRPEPGLFPQRQIELVQTFADQAVIAIENARLFNEVQARTAELQQSLEDLRNAQDRLVQSEKLASLGQLTAGIAHEIKNPLNFVNNFSALSGDLIDELREVLEPATLDAKTRDEVDELTGMLKGNLEKVVQHGKRADSIVKNMLLHSREGSGDHRPVDVNALVEESMNLAYHGARAEKPGFNVTLAKQLDPAAGEADLYAQEVTRVLLNLISNGFYAASKRKQESGDSTFEPTLSATTKNLGDSVEIRIRDNGSGIPDDIKAKMFNPFFTTKPAGEGTGLGLSLSHDIVVKQHGGTLDVATQPDAFTEFTIVLPRAGIASTGQKSVS